MRIVGRAVLLSLLLATTLPGLVLAHADLISSTPAAGSVVAPVAEVVLTFSEAVVGNSSFSVLDTSGAVIATGGPDAADPTVMRATLPPLGGGAFEVRWTSVAADGDVQHGTFTFNFAVSTQPVGSPTLTAATPATATAPASVPPSASPSDQGPGTSTGADVLIPIAVVGILVGVGLGWFLRRRGAT